MADNWCFLTPKSHLWNRWCYFINNMKTFLANWCFTQGLCLCVCLCVLCACTFKRLSKFVGVYRFKCLPNVYVWASKFTHMSMFVCAYTHTHTHTHMHANLYAHPNTHKFRDGPSQVRMWVWVKLNNTSPRMRASSNRRERQVLNMTNKHHNVLCAGELDVCLRSIQVDQGIRLITVVLH